MSSINLSYKNLSGSIPPELGNLSNLLCNNGLKKLPIGSTLDAKTGTFYWSPGPGFLGKYSLVFVLTAPDGQSFKKTVEIKIVPKFKTGEW